MGWHNRSNNLRDHPWLLIAIAIMALLLMPVDYRAGANSPHPHAMLQLIYEASHGIPLHHHAVDYVQDQSDASMDDHADMNRTKGDAMPLPTTSVGGTMRPGPDAAEQQDGSLSFVSLSLFAILHALNPALRLPARRSGGSRHAVRVPRGFVLCPEPPPPQFRAVAPL